MKFFDVGQEAEGFIAIGQVATGVIAIGQVATGVIAIGQLARGVIAIGQLAVGVVAFGQGVAALTYGGGMVGIAGVRIRQSLLVYGVLGTSDPWPRGRRLPTFAPVERKHTSGAHTAVRAVLAAALAAAVVWIALWWMLDLPDRIDSPPPAPSTPPTTFEPGTR